MALAAELEREGHPGDAEDVLRSGIARGQRSPRLYHALGVLYMNHRLYDGAAEEFRCQVELTPKDAEANIRLAECYSLVGLRDKAQKYFEIAAKLRPSDPDIYLGLAYLNSSNQRASLATKYLQKYVQLSKSPGQGYLLLSRILVNQNRYPEAIAAGLKGVAAMPANADMWYNLGQAYAYAHDDRLLPKAEEAFQRVMQLDPSSGHGHFEMGRIYTRLGRIDDAVTQYAEAVRCEPLFGKYYYQYGRALAQARRPAEATKAIARSRELLPLNQREDHLRDRITSVPNDAKSWAELGDIYRQYGQMDKARSCAEKALSISPGLPAARTLEQELASASPSSQAPKQ